jgi:hypothetical protein
MRTPRFSIRSLLAVIAISGVVLAMLRSPLPVWANIAYTVAIAAIVAAASSAILGREARRAYWVGFSLFGAIYLMNSDQLVTQTMLDLLYPYLAPQLPEPALTSAPVVVAPPGTSTTTPVQYTYISQPVPPAGSIPPSLFPSAPAPATSAWEYWMKPDGRTGEFFPAEYVSYSSNAFRRIGHSFGALLAAMLGGAFVRWRYEETSRKGQVPEVAA